MNLKTLSMIAILAIFGAHFAHAQDLSTTQISVQDDQDELDPFAANVNQVLENFDKAYEAETGLSAHLPTNLSTTFAPGCVRQGCAVWAQVVKSTQTIYIFVNGKLEITSKISSGIPGRGTPNFDTHPDGRIYDHYTSNKFPGGDYNGLGNMPYAVFISGGFAIHGTPKGNWGKLGHVASHGCIRVHPDIGLKFNRLVRQAGVDNTWITVQN